MADETATTSGEEHVASPPEVSKAQEIPMKRAKMLHQNWLLIRMPQNMLYWLMKQPPHQVRNMLLHPQKYLKPKKYPKKGQNAAPKLVVNQNATKHALLANETATTSGEEHVASPPKVSKAKEIPKKGQKAAPKPVARKRVIPQKASALHDKGGMACDSDLDVEDYYIVEDDNESDSSEYVPCINYPNDKVYPEDENNGWGRLDEDTGPPNIYRFEGSC